MPSTKADRGADPGAQSGTLHRLASHALLAGLSLLAIFPLYWMVVTALRPENEIFSTAPFPIQPSLVNVERLLSEIPFLRMLANTFVVSAAVTALQLVSALMAGYAFARWRGRASQVLFGLLAVTWLIPPQVIMVPNYVLISHLGLLDTLAALIVPNLASAFSIIMLYQAFRSFPQDVIDAAVIDGAGHWTLLWRIIAPSMRAQLTALGILVFLTTWNEYFWPLLVTRSMDQAVIQIGLQMFFTAEGNQWGPLMAAASLATLPVLAVYAIFQRQIADSFVRSGLR
jgi:sn-glycerol 3-phosphate transport system permease protein